MPSPSTRERWVRLPAGPCKPVLERTECEIETMRTYIFGRLTVSNAIWRTLTPRLLSLEVIWQGVHELEPPISSMNCVLRTSKKLVRFARALLNSWKLEAMSDHRKWIHQYNILYNIKVEICRMNWQPTPVFLPGKSNRQRSLVGYSPQGHKELDTTEVT